jgi:hypothetical protein
VYLPVPPQPDCASAWLEAVKMVDGKPGHEAHNVIIDVENPVAGATLAHPIVRRVNDFLAIRDKSVECIANTIFPQSLYQLHGMPQFIEVFNKQVLPKVRKNARWSGYYFERMTNELDQLSGIVERMRDENNASRNKFEVALFDPKRDVDGSPYGGQCLSLLSFHLLAGMPKTLLLTAQYRNHYYVEKLLGNLIGLGRLMAFVAKETKTQVGALTVVSTHAQIDLPKASRQDIAALLQQCAQPVALTQPAA